MVNARIIRRSFRRSLQMLRWKRWNLQGIPVLFANSFPKSGTHLLTQVLQGFPLIGPAMDSGMPAIVTYDGKSGHQRSIETIMDELNRLLPGDIGYGHLLAFQQVIDLINQPGFAFYFILRDPRDVVVSHVHYVTNMKSDHVHHAYYTQELTNFDQRLRTSILGRQDENVPFPDIRARFQGYLGWCSQREVLTVRFEEFRANQLGTISQILDHAVQHGFPLMIEKSAAVDKISSQLDPKRSPTFRSGKTGGWQQAFSQENKDLFKQVSGDLLIQLGYEKDDDW